MNKEDNNTGANEMGPKQKQKINYQNSLQSNPIENLNKETNFEMNHTKYPEY